MHLCYGCEQHSASLQVLEFESAHLDSLPSAQMYERSYMHRDQLSHVEIAQAADFIITGSVDGHIKFWKKRQQGVEFAKQFRAHLGAIAGMLCWMHESPKRAIHGLPLLLLLIGRAVEELVQLQQASHLSQSRLAAVRQCLITSKLSKASKSLGPCRGGACRAPVYGLCMAVSYLRDIWIASSDYQ